MWEITKGSESTILQSSVSSSLIEVSPDMCIRDTLGIEEELLGAEGGGGGVRVAKGGGGAGGVKVEKGGGVLE